MQRRQFLQRVGASAAVAAGGLALPRSLRAASPSQVWGDYPAAHKQWQVGEDKRAKRVLDIMLAGGISPWESFYVVPAYGVADQTLWWTFQNGANSIKAWHQQCNGYSAPLTQPWLTDAAGASVHLGPHVVALRQRPDVLARMRVLVMQHKIEPHEAAIPIAVTGSPIGAANAASLGAVVQHAALAAANGALAQPTSYALSYRYEGNFIGRTMYAHGSHPVASRPIDISLFESANLIKTLQRQGLAGQHAKVDALAAYYSEQFGKRLSPAGGALPARAPAWFDHAFATQVLSNAPALAKILDSGIFAPSSVQACGKSLSPSVSRMQLQVAAHLLQQPGGPVRHMAVMDSGISPGSQGWDAHSDHVKDSAVAADAFWSELMAIIRAPGEVAPHKIDLDETMIVINTEFGRTPGKQGNQGRNHWPYGYVTLMIGGPIGTQQAGLRGSINQFGIAKGGITPVQQRAAVLTAMGIWPFAPECYPVGLFPGGGDGAAAKWLRDDVLGLA